MVKAKLLIAEDESIVAMELRQSLMIMGYQVTAIVNSGERAIENAQNDPPDLILLDIRLKGELDGIDTANLIRTRFKIPVVFLTAYLDEDKLERAKLTMPFGYLLKPVQDRDLKATIEMALYTAAIDAERKQAEQALMESEQQYQDLFDSMLDGYALHEMIFDEEGAPSNYRFLKINPAFERLTKLKGADIIGKTVQEVLPDIEDLWIQRYGEVVKSGDPAKFVNIAQELDKYYEVIAYRPAPGQFACVFKDVTAQKKAEAILQQSDDIVNNIQVGLHIYSLEDINDDRTLRLISANQSSERLTGVPVADLIGKTLDENFPGLREKGIPQKYAEVVRTQKAEEIDDIYYGDDRVIRAWFRVKAFPLPDNCMGVAFEDITEQKIADQERRETEEKFRCVMENSPNQVIILDRNFQIEYINRTREQDAQQLIGKPIFDFLPEDSKETVHAHLEKVIQGGSLQQFPVDYRSSSGQTWTYQSHLGPIKKTNVITGFTIINIPLNE